MRPCTVLARILSYAVPAGPCVLCGEDSEGGPAPGLCRRCWRTRRKPLPPLCPVCGLPLPPVEGQEPHPCGACLVEPPPYEAHVSAYLYKGPVRALVLLYKDKRRYPLAALLGTAVARAALRRWPGAPFDCVAWVPSPLSRRLSRGFEPAGLVARVAARRLGLPARPLLKCRKRPLPQKGLSAAARRENVRAAFALSKSEIEGLRVLLVDDVRTTGATLAEAARVLVRKGAVVRAATFAFVVTRDLDLAGGDGSDASGEAGREP